MSPEKDLSAVWPKAAEILESVIEEAHELLDKQGHKPSGRTITFTDTAGRSHMLNADRPVSKETIGQTLDGMRAQLEERGLKCVAALAYRS